MWYVIQTVTGKEEELTDMMNTILERDLYRDCFIIRAEWMKRLGGQWQTQVRPLFPGYVFVDSEQPEELFFSLKRVPRFSRIIGNGRFEFTPVEESEKTFLETLMWGDVSGGESDENSYLVRRSLIDTTEDGKIFGIHGALRLFEDQIERISLHKRYAVVRVRFLQREQTVLLGIRLGKDEAAEIGEQSIAEIKE